MPDEVEEEDKDEPASLEGEIDKVFDLMIKIQ